MRLIRVLVVLGCLLSTTAEAANLIDVYNTALQNDPTFRNAEATWMSNKELSPIARAAMLPQLSANGSYQYSWNRNEPYNSTASTKPQFSTVGYGLTLDQSIFNYNSWATLQGANASVKAAEASYNKAAQSLIQSTITAYTTVLSSYEQLRFQRAKTQYLLQSLRANKQKFDVGLIAITDVYDIQAQYDAAVADEIADQNTLSANLESLRAITGTNYNTLRGIRDSIPLRTPRPNNISAWSRQALTQNYDVLAARYKADAAHEGVNAAVGTLLPSLRAEGKFNQSFNSKGIGTGLKNQTAAVAGLSLSVPIFNGGVNYATLKQKRYDYLATSALLTQAQRSAVSQTRQDYLSVIADISAVEANRQAVKSSNESLKSNEAGYRVGTKTITDVLQAIQALYQNEQLESSAQYKYINDIISLKSDVGTLSLADVKTINSLFRANFSFKRPLAAGHAYTIQSANKIKKHSVLKAVQHSAYRNKPKPTLRQRSNIVKSLSHSPSSATLNQRYYAIQLYSGSNLHAAKAFVLNSLASDKDNLSIVKMSKNGKTSYKVVRGWFSSYATAHTAFAKIPKHEKRFKPWITHLNPGDKFVYGVMPENASQHKGSAKAKVSLPQENNTQPAPSSTAVRKLATPPPATTHVVPQNSDSNATQGSHPVVPMMPQPTVPHSAGPAQPATQQPVAPSNVQPAQPVTQQPVAPSNVQPAQPATQQPMQPTLEQHQHFVPKPLPNVPSHPQAPQ